MTSRVSVAIFGGLLLAITALMAALFLLGPLRAWAKQQWLSLTTEPTAVIAEPSPIPTPTPDPLAPFAIALLGYGGGGHDGGLLTDSIIVAKIIPKQQQVVLISVPRDLWIELPIASDSTKPFKINAAYAIGSDKKQYLNRPAEYQGEHGGGALAKYALEQVVGVPIQRYLAVSFASFQTSVDTLGGVDVMVPFSFTDEFYPIAGKEDDACEKSPEDIAALTATMSGYKLEQQFVCRYEVITFAKGTQHMDGTTALKFVRSRHSSTNGSDFGRSLRQQAFVRAVKQKVFSFSFVPKLPQLIEKNLKHITTDIDVGLFAQLLTTYPNPADFSISTISLSDQNVLKPTKSADGQYILVPKEPATGWQSIQAYITEQEQQLTLPTATVSPGIIQP
jgi:polyisoprenyl-teichoic acid--peptidoglycan teichoic acid transferase